MVTYGANIISVKGKIGGNYFQKSNFGNHIKACPRRVKSQNITLQTTRKIFSTVQNAWRNKVWSSAEICKWNAFNRRHPVKNGFGDPKTLTLQLSFIKYNLIRVRNNLPVSFIPPREIV